MRQVREGRREPEQAESKTEPRSAPEVASQGWLTPELGRFTIYLLVFIAAEVAVLQQRTSLALAIDAILMLTLMIRSQLSGGRESDLQIALIVPLSVRLFVLAFPLDLLPAEAHLPVVGSVLILTTLMAARLLGYSLGTELRLNLRHPDYIPLVALFGVPLGLIAFELLRPEALTSTLTVRAALWPSANLLLFTGLAEEVLFRGLVLTAAVRSLGANAGLTLAASFYAASHIASGSWTLVVLGAVIGVAAGWIVLRLRSITGVVLAHGIMNILLLVVRPLLGS